MTRPFRSAAVHVIATDVARRLLTGRDIGGKFDGEEDLLRYAISFFTAAQLQEWPRQVNGTEQKARWQHLQHLLDRVTVLPFDEGVRCCWDKLDGSGSSGGPVDANGRRWIAATCIARDLPLITLEHSDFSRFTTGGLRFVKFSPRAPRYEEGR